MTLIEPTMVGGLAAYIMLPIATYALGFDVSLSWGYAVFFGLVPILLAVPAVLPAAAIGLAFGGAGNPLMQLAVILMLIVVSVSSYAAISHWVHTPETDLQTLALFVSAPFIIGVAIGLLALVALLLMGIVGAMFKPRISEI